MCQVDYIPSIFSPFTLNPVYEELCLRAASGCVMDLLKSDASTLPPGPLTPTARCWVPRVTLICLVSCYIGPGQSLLSLCPWAIWPGTRPITLWSIIRPEARQAPSSQQVGLTHDLTPHGLLKSPRG